MDLEGECSVLVSVEDNEAPTPPNLGNVNEPKTQLNGSRDVDLHDELFADDDTKGMEKEPGESVNSPPFTEKSPGGSVGSTPGTATKGHGLRKWKRIRRVGNKDGGSSVDTGKILKRGLSNPATNPIKPASFSAEMKQKSEGSVSSTQAVFRNPVVVPDGFAALGDPGSAVGPIFVSGTDSENSEDRSSKSSTAASAPNLRYKTSAAVGYARDKNKMKNSSSKNLSGSVQQVQQGKGRIEMSKKPRGERVKIEQENSHSSMESDLQSSNFVFAPGTNSVTSNGRQSGRTANYDGENSDDAQGCEHFNEVSWTGYGVKVVGAFEDFSKENVASDLSWDVKEGKGENHSSSTHHDPLVESILTLQSAQEALEKELQKFREIGKDSILVLDESIQEGSLPSEISAADAKIHAGDSAQSSPYCLDTQVLLQENVNLLKSKLEEVTVMLQMKEAKVVELEAVFSSKSLIEDTKSIMRLQQDKCREMETELESLFREKIEAEVEYLAFSRTIQELRVATVDQMTTLQEEPKTTASEQAPLLNKDAETKAVVLEKPSEKLETSSEENVKNDDVLKLQNMVWKSSSILCMQLVLLLVLVLFRLQLSSHQAGEVPT